MTKQYFSLAQANAMLPALNQAFKRIMQMHNQIHQLYQKLSATDVDLNPEAIEFDLDVLNTQELDYLSSLKILLNAIDEEVAGLFATGCLVKDISQGVVEWPAWHNEQDILFSWKYGEKQVAYWHSADTDFEQRESLATLKIALADTIV